MPRNDFAHTRRAGDAVGLAPHDLDTLSVYADSLAAADPALGEYIAFGVQAARLRQRERVELEACARELFATHGPRWLAAWNTPNALFEPGLSIAAGVVLWISRYGQWSRPIRVAVSVASAAFLVLVLLSGPDGKGLADQLGCLRRR